VDTEHEKLAILAGRRERATYEDLVPVLRGLAERHGWDPKMQGDRIFGASVRAGSLMGMLVPDQMCLQLRHAEEKAVWLSLLLCHWPCLGTPRASI